MTAGLGGCGHCERIAIVRLCCPCGWSIVYCSTCAEWGMRAAFEHTIACDRLATVPSFPQRFAAFVAGVHS